MNNRESTKAELNTVYRSWELVQGNEGNVEEHDCAIRSLTTALETSNLYQSYGVDGDLTDKHNKLQEKAYGDKFEEKIRTKICTHE